MYYGEFENREYTRKAHLLVYRISSVGRALDCRAGGRELNTEPILRVIK